MPEPKFSVLVVPVDVTDDTLSLCINARHKNCGGGSNGSSNKSGSSATKSCLGGVPKNSVCSTALPACCSSKVFCFRNVAFSALKLESSCERFEELLELHLLLSEHVLG